LTSEENKRLVRRYVEEVWNARDASRAGEFFARDYRRHLSPETSLDAGSQERRIASFLSAFPDLHFDLEALFGEGSLVTFRATVSGTHEGEFAGVERTGRRIRVSLIDVVRVENGKLAEHWGGPDTHDLLRQLGE
jgi:predicted ester cyclase